MQPQASQQMINIDGVQYDFASLSPEIQGTIALMEHARQQVQAAQMDMALKTAAHASVGEQLRGMLDAFRAPVAREPVQQMTTTTSVARTKKTPVKQQNKRR